MNALVVVLVACLVSALDVSAETTEYTEQFANMGVEELASFGACLLDEASCSEKTSKLKGLLSSLYVYTPLL
jgi:hypothetical protein